MPIDQAIYRQMHRSQNHTDIGFEIARCQVECLKFREGVPCAVQHEGQVDGNESVVVKEEA